MIYTWKLQTNIKRKKKKKTDLINRIHPTAEVPHEKTDKKKKRKEQRYGKANHRLQLLDFESKVCTSVLVQTFLVCLQCEASPLFRPLVARG